MHVWTYTELRECEHRLNWIGIWFIPMNLDLQWSYGCTIFPFVGMMSHNLVQFFAFIPEKKTFQLTFRIPIQCVQMMSLRTPRYNSSKPTDRKYKRHQCVNSFSKRWHTLTFQGHMKCGEFLCECWIWKDRAWSTLANFQFACLNLRQHNILCALHTFWWRKFAPWVSLSKKEIIKILSKSW